MSKLTEKVSASAALRGHIPPARPMPPIRARTPGWIAAKVVGSFVPGLTKKAFEKFGFSAAALITDWERIAGAKIAAYTEPQRLKWPRLPGGGEAGEEGRPGATLVLKVDPARALDAEYATAQIIDRINAYFGYRAVAEIRLIQAPLTAPVIKNPRASQAGLVARASQGAGPGQRAAEPAQGSGPANPLDAALARMGAGVAARQGRAPR